MQGKAEETTTSNNEPMCVECGRPMWHHSYPKETCPPPGLVLTVPVSTTKEQRQGVANKEVTLHTTYGVGNHDATE